MLVLFFFFSLSVLLLFFAFSLLLLSVRFPYMFIARHTTVTLPPKYGVVDERAHINSLRRGRQERFSLLTAYTVEMITNGATYTQRNNNEDESESIRIELSRVESSGVSKREKEKKKKKLKAYGQCLYACH